MSGMRCFPVWGAAQMPKLLSILLMVLAFTGASVAEASAAPTFSSHRISVEVRGMGPDVILIPGLCSHPEVWDQTVAAVPGYRYHIVHLAGFAGKPADANAAGPVLVPVANEIVRYIYEAHLNHPALVGHSLGGTVEMIIAARHPKLASRIMVVDMFPFLGIMFGPPGATAESIRPTAEKVRGQFGSKTGEARLRAIEHQVATTTKNQAWRPRLVERTLHCDVAVAREAFYETIMTDLRPELSKIKVPMLVLWQYPPEIPLKPNQLEQIYRDSYSNARQVTIKQIPDAWHFIMLDQPDLFQRELRQFLKHGP
jgi:pimeloyl-ACP methyl ester carboxylesterase